MSLDRRSFNKAILAAASVGLLPALPAWAQEIKSLKIIAPAGPGGGYDQLARAIQEILTGEKLATSVQVLNVPGAGGTVGLAQFVNSKERDPVAHGRRPRPGRSNLYQQVPREPRADHCARATSGRVSASLRCRNSPIKTVGDLISKFKENPGSVSWGGFAHGSPDHLLCGLVVKAAGGDVKKMNYIPVGTGGEMLPLVMSGKVTVATGGLNEVAGQFKAGKLRPIGISSPERLPGVDIPTFREQGIDATLVNWRGVMAPANISAEDKQSLEAAVAKLVQSDHWKKLLQEREWVDLYMPSDQFAAFLKDEQTRISALLKELGLA